MGSFSPHRWPLALQMAAAFALVTALALAGGGALLLQQATLRTLADQSAAVLARANTAADLAAELWDQPAGALTLSLYRFQRQTEVRPVVVDRSGRVMADASDASPLLGARLTHPEVAAALGGRQVTGTRTLPGGEWVMYGAVPVRRGGERMGAVLVSASIAAIAAARQQLQRQLTLVAGVVETLAVLLGIWLARSLSRPLVHLSSAAAQLAKGRLETRVTPGGSRELQHLSHSFNRMAVELGRLDRQRRAFVADASHELRTPVAAIRALAEGLLGASPDSAVTHTEYLTDIVRECDRAGRLIDRLLQLARLDARREARPPAATALEAVDLRQVTEEIVHAMEPLAQERGVALQLAPGEAITVRADPYLVQTVVGNLVENGLKYTGGGGRVCVELAVQGAAASVTVADTGIGISPEDLPHIFQRFYRVDKARSRATGGAGLGLSIAAEAAALLGGGITVASQPGRGSRFTLTFPAG